MYLKELCRIQTPWFTAGYQSRCCFVRKLELVRREGSVNNGTGHKSGKGNEVVMLVGKWMEVGVRDGGCEAVTTDDLTNERQQQDGSFPRRLTASHLSASVSPQNRPKLRHNSGICTCSWLAGGNCGQAGVDNDALKGQTLYLPSSAARRRFDRCQ